MVEYPNNRFACEALDGQIQDDRYKVIDDVIYYKNKIYLVSESQLKEKIMQTSYDSPLAGHPSFVKAYRKIRERFLWRDLKGDVLRYVKECNICQQNKAKHTLPATLLQLLPILEQKLGSISMDFIPELPQVPIEEAIVFVPYHYFFFLYHIFTPVRGNCNKTTRA